MDIFFCWEFLFQIYIKTLILQNEEFLIHIISNTIGLTILIYISCATVLCVAVGSIHVDLTLTVDVP